MSDTPDTSTPAVREIDTAQAVTMGESGALLLDVREDDEWQAGHADGAIHVPLGGLDPASIAHDGPIVAICRSGNRSGQAALRLQAAGHDVVNMAGGMKAWHEADLPMVTDRGAPGALK